MEKIIIDTDLGYDCDDSGTLVLANKLHSQKIIDVLAVTHCVNRNEGGMAIKHINSYYGNDEIPIGVSDNYAFNVDDFYEAFYKNLKYNENFTSKSKCSF